ncbi:MAG: polyphosphate kinase 1, partial [Gammaproteobacteria bacterium]|nr:polyphosphate kinase 1 [Gammaproteobacteria bacterium]
VFDFMVHSYRAYTFKHLWVSPVNVRDKLYALIDYEIEQAKAGNKARISIKINNIDDHEVIKRLYEASSAGVKIRIIVRGMCSLVPGVEGVSENISVISIVGRFLEHPRYFIFHHAGNQQVYISSADLMTRNLDRRVEVGCPILDETLKNQIVDIFNLQWSDNTKARIIDREQANNYKSRGNKRKVRSQIEIYDYLKEWNKLLAKSNEEHPAG